uniref:Cytochrome b5 heme-binding domain-containing protein n=1 Tax=Chromera velia CCMP2878 TaxID=1169474 RepID=A0A0G4FB31_9ALVE|eukprot:Cvel_16007.t1-p1 / transcript=Cvel_16007.t1 / gene=Cvel_16007 / organism=Chromera_velia_CCMP2878 / gene_product=Membrane steroid-binding protein 2, putative / transcript_product=Membrane steroid-binding protein 2, putative / location=Cvel_scaffold1214:15062-18508(-) / protein_length=160 / sequence_SO=supercontig / SO=protein_coding / is_pseudo=false
MSSSSQSWRGVVLLGAAAGAAGLAYLWWKNQIQEAEEREMEERVPFVKPPKPNPCPKDFTPAELAEFDGSDGKPVYIGCKGVVYDMTSHPDGRTMYGPGGSYNVFAGKDATRAFAKFNFDQQEMNKGDWSDLNVFENEMLQSWVDKFDSKYDVVGKVVFT